MRGGVDIARAYDLPDSVELQKVESKTLDLDLDDTFTTFEKSPCEVKEVVELLTPKAINTQSNELHPFIVASMNGQISRVEAMLKKENVDVNMFTEAHKLTALMGACHQGHTEVARLLIEHGANGNMVANEGSSALSLACQEGHYETAKLLLENGANPNVQGETKCTPLMLASFCGHYRVVNLLLRYNAKVNLVDSLQRSALMIACNNGHYDVAEILLKHDAQIDAQDVVGCTALIFASNHGHFEVAKLLLEHGAKPDIKNSNKESALSIACQQSHYSIAKLLVEKLKGTENWMYIINHALLVASQGGHFPLVKLLIDNGAQVSIKNALGASSLNLASENGHYEVVELLLEKGAEVDAQDLNGRTSLMGASYFGHLKIVRLLVDKGAQVNIQDKRRGSFPLMEASSQGRHSIVKHLLAHGAQVDMQSKDGLTALLVACYYGQFRVVSLLLDKSADLNLQEKHHGASPLLVSSWKGHTDIAQLLLDNGAKVDQLLTHAYGYGASSLLLASQNGHYEIVELLLDKNAQIDLLTNNPDHPRSALMLASQLGHYDICKLLLERGARIELQERSALMLAANSKISQLLLENGAKVDYQDDRGLFPLAEACKRGDYDTVMLLLKRGAGVDLQAQQMTSLMMSCHMDFYDITKLLLDHGANPNLPDSGGLSSLHYASFFGRTRVVKLLIARGAQSDLRAQGHAALILAGNVEIVNLLMGITEFSLSRQDLFEALQIAVHANNAPMVKYFFNKCLEIIGNIFCLNTDPGFPEIAFFKDKVEKRITSEGAEIECAGLSVSIPKGTIAEEDSTDLLIRPCFSGPFELPPGYVSASPAFLIQPDRHVTMKKDVTVRIHHYADLCTEEDCEDMVFLSASPTPHKSSGVYWFKKIERVRCLFRAGDPVGEIKVRHFCLIKVVRWIGRKRQSRVNRDRCTVRLYRNLTPNAHTDLSAVFCVCLDHPKYVQHCDRVIRNYHAISDGNEAADLSVQKGTMISDEIVLSTIPKSGWNVFFDKTPTKILRSDLQVDVPLAHLRDYPPQFLVYVRQTSIHENSDIFCVPELQVQGLDKGECCFQLMIPGRGFESSLQLSHQLHVQDSDTLRENVSESDSEARREAESTLTLRNVLTAVLEVASEWRNLGLALDIKQPTIDSIEAEHFNVKRCLEEVIKCWLNGNGGELSWSFLCEALKSPLVARPKVAGDIEQKYINIQ